MAVVRIIFKGMSYDIHNVVDEEQFEKIYKPKGWVLENQEEEKKDPYLEELQKEEEIKNYKTMKSKKPKAFDDGLVKKKD